MDLCICGELDKEDSEFTVRFDNNRRFGKTATIVEPVDTKIGPNLCTELKKHFACGGTYKNNQIILHGEHREVYQYLKNKGYNVRQR